MKIHTSPVKANPWANQVKVSRDQDGKWLIVRGANWTELPAYSFDNWDHALWTGIAWSNDEYLKEIEYAEVEAIWQLQHGNKKAAAENA